MKPLLALLPTFALTESLSCDGLGEAEGPMLDGPLTSPTDLRFAPKKGYAQPPGTGPHNATCHSCRHRVPMACDKKQWFCGLVPSHRADRGVVISLSAAACSRWEKTGD